MLLPPLLDEPEDEESVVTVTVQTAVLSPAPAVIVVVPLLTAVTMPFSTVATFSSAEVQVTVLSVALSGVTVAVNVAVAPRVSDKVLVFKFIASTATTGTLRVILSKALLA